MVADHVGDGGLRTTGCHLESEQLRRLLRLRAPRGQDIGHTDARSAQPGADLALQDMRTAINTAIAPTRIGINTTSTKARESRVRNAILPAPSGVRRHALRQPLPPSSATTVVNLRRNSPCDARMDTLPCEASSRGISRYAAAT